jgi:hypothetical protein
MGQVERTLRRTDVKSVYRYGRRSQQLKLVQKVRNRDVVVVAFVRRSRSRKDRTMEMATFSTDGLLLLGAGVATEGTEVGVFLHHKKRKEKSR